MKKAVAYPTGCSHNNNKSCMVCLDYFVVENMMNMSTVNNINNG